MKDNKRIKNGKKAKKLTTDSYGCDNRSPLREPASSTVNAMAQKANEALGQLKTSRWEEIDPLQRTWILHYHGGEHRDDASDIHFLVMGGAAGYDCCEPSEKDTKNLQTLHCRFPLQDLAAEGFSIQELLQRWCALLQPYHGRAGISFGVSTEYQDSSASERLETELLLRFPGLNFWHTGEDIYARLMDGGLYYGIRSTDWLIILHDLWLDKLCGLEAVKQAMQPLPVLPYNQGSPYPHHGPSHCLCGRHDRLPKMQRRLSHCRSASLKLL